MASSSLSLQQELQLFEELLLLLQDVLSTHYANVAAVMILIYDHIITFPDEVELVWKGRWNLGKVLFIWNRYYYLAFLLAAQSIDLNNTASNEFCLRWGQIHPWLAIASSATVEFILSFRVWALYGKARWMTVFLGLLFLAEMSSLIAITAVTLTNVGVLARPGPFLAGCLATGVPSFFWTIFIPPTVSSCILFGLTLARTIKTVWDMGFGHAPLVSLFLRDGTTYFAFIFMTLLINTLMFVLARPTLSPLALSFCYSIPCVMSSRLLLNVRDTGRLGNTWSVDTSPQPPSSGALSYGSGPKSPMSGKSETDEESCEMRVFQAM